MLQPLSSVLRRRSVSAVALAAVTFGALLLLVPGLAGALSLSQSVPAPPASPTSADEIQNVDQVKTAIKGYYGDTVTSQLDPVAGTVALHQMSPTGAYANEMAGVVADAEKELGKPKADRTSNKAVLFDVDDTMLNTYRSSSSPGGRSRSAPARSRT